MDMAHQATTILLHIFYFQCMKCNKALGSRCVSNRKFLFVAVITHLRLLAIITSKNNPTQTISTHIANNSVSFQAFQIVANMNLLGEYVLSSICVMPGILLPA